MKTLIIEDEKAAVRNLMALLTEAGQHIEVTGILDSITESVEWFSSHPMPELIFMDIHLADGSAFEIFGQVHITCPVIFTTAYDEYALQAFKVNSIEYLLKPIGKSDIERALDKLRILQKQNVPSSPELQSLLQSFRKASSYKTHFLIPLKGDKLFPLPVNAVVYFYIQNGIVKAVADDAREYLMTQTLDELADCLNPELFFRVNRQYILSKNGIKDIDLWFNNRLSVNLSVPVQEKILVSRSRVQEFKEWISG